MKRNEIKTNDEHTHTLTQCTIEACCAQTDKIKIAIRFRLCKQTNEELAIRNYKIRLNVRFATKITNQMLNS